MPIRPRDQLDALLADLRDNPVSASNTPDDTLAELWEYLMELPKGPDQRYHWFCGSADSTTRETAIFMTRLFAYNARRAEEWKERLALCLSECAQCVQGLQEIKFTSRHTYFGAISPNVLSTFWESFDKWERRVVQDGISKAQFPSEAGRTLAHLPLPLVTHMLSHVATFKDPDVLSLIRSAPPNEPLQGLPMDPPPIGILYLLFDADERVQGWAKMQMAQRRSTPLPSDAFEWLCAKATLIRDVLNALSGQDAANWFPFAKDQAVLWAGLPTMLSVLPDEKFTTRDASQVELRHVVLNHLHDSAQHFSSVLKSFVLLLARAGSELWKGEEPEYPQIIFDAIKDNPSYLEMVLSIQANDEKPWVLAWSTQYLISIWDHSLFSDALAKLSSFFCEELQHERFGKVRPVTLSMAARMLSWVLEKAKGTRDCPNATALAKVLDIHVEVLVGAAFGRGYGGDRWSKTRSSASSLIKAVLVHDQDSVVGTITDLCRLLGRIEDAKRLKTEARKAGKPLPEASPSVRPVRIPSVRKQVWAKMYNTLQADDSGGIATIIELASRTAYMDSLNENAFRPAFKEDPAGPSRGRTAFNAVNAALKVFSDGFSDCVTKYANYASSTKVLDLLQHPNVVKHLVVLLFSAVDNVQSGAETLIGQAFDVDGRIDCFRALLENLPGPTLEGIFSHLATFEQYSKSMPEACSLSQSLVRCLTDVMDVLCCLPDGLLRNSRFLGSRDAAGPTVEMPKLWTLMSKALAIIFKRTPGWAVHFENEAMVVWMRDALIFGRELLGQKDFIASVIAGNGDQSAAAQADRSKRLRRVKRTLLEDLQPVLFELTRWMKLTHYELLHQSFSLIESLLDSFKKAGIPPSSTALAKLDKYVQDGRNKKDQTRLDSTRIDRLEAALAALEESDDEVQIISVEKKKAVAPPRTKPETSRKGSFPEASSSRKTTGSTQAQTKPKAKAPQQSKSGLSRFTAADQRALDERAAMPRLPSRAQKSSPIDLTGSRRSSMAASSRAGSSRSSMAGSSSSEEEDSDDEQGPRLKGLAALANLQSTPKIRKPERRQIKLLDIPTSKNPMEQRLQRRDDVRRTTLRLKPDISGLHRMLLSWNYDHEGNTPPNSGNTTAPTRVPDVFRDPQHYIRVFEPLLMMECWAQIVQSKDEPSDIYTCNLVSRHNVDDWLELDIAIADAVSKDWRLADTDVVLLRQVDGKASVLAKAQTYKHSPFHGVQATLRCYLNQAVDPGLQLNSKWRLKKVFSLSTLHREYAALMALPYYDFLGGILQPRLDKKPSVSEEEIRSTMSSYSVNEPQAVAIISALRSERFTLIQGPPGTGKTSTICGLVQAFMAKRKKSTPIAQPGRSAVPLAAPKVLLCAPSNAAIDEIAARLKDGVSGAGKRGVLPKVVRVGAEKAINISVKDISLDALVDEKLNMAPDASNLKKDSGGDIAAVRRELDEVKQQKQQKQEESAGVHDNAAKTRALDDEIRKLNGRRIGLVAQLNKLRDQQTLNYRSLDAARRKARLDVLQEADVICSTLSGAGHDLLEGLDIDMVIIDEAAQAIELSSLIPLKYRCNRCIMVGDPKQLPPTVLSQEASQYQYNQSLFVRLSKHQPDAIHLLSIQYRMHPDISVLPSKAFYDGRLQDGPAMAEKTRQPWHDHDKFGPYRFFSVTKGQEESGSRRSLVNRTECQVAVALYTRLRREFASVDLDYRVGVVSMYRAQIAEMRRTFEQRFGSDIVGKVDFNTVDGFQGQEKDVIILSCVRAGASVKSIGFLADTRRMNVALTRARSSLFILGHASTLERNDETWSTIVSDARSRGHLQEIDVGYFTAAGSSNTKVISSKAKAASTTKKVPAPQAEAHAPEGLATPQELASKSSQKSTSTIQQSNGVPIPMDTAEDPTRKRRNSDTEAPEQLPQANGSAPAPRPKPPPPKRQKQGAGLFIPKPAKRPPR